MHLRHFVPISWDDLSRQAIPGSKLNVDSNRVGKRLHWRSTCTYVYRKHIQLARSVYVSMKTEVGWLALFSALVYEVVQAVPPRIFNHAVSFIASAVWGS